LRESFIYINVVHTETKYRGTVNVKIHYSFWKAYFYRLLFSTLDLMSFNI